MTSTYGRPQPSHAAEALARLDPAHLLRAVAARVPDDLRENIVVIGSIATAWCYRDVLEGRSVVTKDIDLLLRPSVDAVATAESLGKQLLNHGWQPHYPNGVKAASADTPDKELPALRLTPPNDDDLWFVELLAEPPADQRERKYWRRFLTDSGAFELPSFRFMRVAIHATEKTEWGLRVARPPAWRSPICWNTRIPIGIRSPLFQADRVALPRTWVGGWRANNLSPRGVLKSTCGSTVSAL